MKTCITGFCRQLLLFLLLAVPVDCLAQCCPPTITSQPQPQTVLQGQPAMFSVGVNSTTTPTFYWYRNTTLLYSGPASNYVISVTSTNDAGTYFVAVTNASPGGVVSDGTATLTVHVKPYIVTQPASQTKLITSNVTFSVVAGGTATLTHQWRFNGGNLAGKTGSSCTINNLTTNNAGNYTVVVSNPYGSVTSAVAVLTVTYINLAPYQPSGWSDKIVISTLPGTTTNNTPLTTTNTLYVDFSLINNGTASASGAFTNQLYLDGVLRISPAITGGGFLSPGFSVNINDYSPGILSEGPHTLMMRVDSSNQINELDEGDNDYTRPFTVIMPPGFVAAWGDNGSGQATVPPGLSNMVGLAAGGFHSLALNSDNTVVAWGDDTYGQGSGPAGLSNVVAITAGTSNTLALKSDGSVASFGDNSFGQTNVPAGLTSVVAVKAGQSHCLALRNGGSVATWGDNSSGQTNIASAATNVIAIAAGDGHSLALRVNSTVVGWGDNSSGQSTAPPGLTNVTAIAAGGAHSLALKTDGTVVAWGNNAFGQTNVPAGLSNVMAIAGGANHSLALRKDRTVVAWGDNAFGQTNVPVWLSNVVAIATHGDHNLALTLDQPPATITPLVLTVDGFVGNGFKITVTGPLFTNVVIESSVGLVNWNDRHTNNTGAGGTFTYTDGNASNFNHRYYRARLQ